MLGPIVLLQQHVEIDMYSLGWTKSKKTRYQYSSVTYVIAIVAVIGASLPSKPAQLPFQLNRFW
jgi:hypothetical protein